MNFDFIVISDKIFRQLFPGGVESLSKDVVKDLTISEAKSEMFPSDYQYVINYFYEIGFDITLTLLKQI